MSCHSVTLETRVPTENIAAIATNNLWKNAFHNYSFASKYSVKTLLKTFTLEKYLVKVYNSINTAFFS